MAENYESNLPTLVCSLSEPRKELQGTRDCYVSYLIVTRSTLPSFPKSEIKIRRRFSDFTKLHEIISRMYQDCIVPPLPGKQRLEYIKGGRFSDEFISRRASLLNRYLQRCSSHPVLHSSPHFIAFLSNSNWNNYVKLTIQPKLNATSKLEDLSDAFLNAFTKLREQKEEYAQQKEHIQQITSGIVNMESILQRLSKLERVLEQNYHELSDQFGKLMAMNGISDVSLDEMQLALRGTRTEFAGLADNSHSLLDALKDIEAYTLAYRDLLKRRDQKQLDVEALEDFLVKLNKEKEKLLNDKPSGLNFMKTVNDLRGINHEESLRKQMEQVDTEINTVEQAIQEATEVSMLFDKRVNEEAQFFNAVRQAEMVDVMRKYAKLHVQFFSAIKDIWEINKQEP
ncbi:autophagy associated protein Atg24 [Schizosaccharomyces japonicus yFS275]|uniref:Sorting nexin-4 n=1 Tax=Schizosaccharomyces japonicus (strain yFS275 / FY16936) TaxID=402676 RepID=B6JXS1_SCHJY|nr:autophagy associated protein Atg24 [Schizosaccharomyces japonicus yFS275]EEB06339.1 autophagy associated protein Atg24 [Schizosaccharomyces japonicus yFS275]